MAAARPRYPGHGAAVALVVLGLAACAGVPTAAGEGTCEAGDTPMLRDTLYFGRNQPRGGVVGDDELQVFVDQIVTPRFPSGLTVHAATGQWRGASGVVEREASQVLTLLHAGSERERQAVAEIADEYRRRFGQEAVLRERSPSCVRF